MKKIIWSLFIIILTFLTAFSAKTVNAASLNFDQTSVEVAADETFQLQVNVDAGSEEINSVDAYVIFDSTKLEAQSVSNGDFFPTVFNDITSGKAYVAGMVDDPATSKTGSGTIATITFKALASGTDTLTFECDTSSSDTSKIVKNDIDATNIIVCSENGSTSVNITGGTTGGGTTNGAGTTGGGTTPSTLPQSGILDNIVKYAVPGMILLMLGGIFKFLL